MIEMYILQQLQSIWEIGRFFYKRRTEIYHHVQGTKDQRIWRNYYLVGQIWYLFSEADHQRIQQLSQKLMQEQDSLGYFYQGLSFFLQNKQDNAYDCLIYFLDRNPYHAEGCYLLAQIEALQGKRSEAHERLKILLQHSTRRKTWQHLANLIDSQKDFEDFHQLFEQHYPQYQNKLLRYDLICHLSNAALRGGQEQFALDLWRTQYQYRLAQPRPQRKKNHKRKNYTDKKAAIALSALKQSFDKYNIPFFLISGTLLGCIRENKLLSHDKDIDVGVWSDFSIEQLSNILRESGCFYILPIYSPDVLVIRHVNGINIDIFRHYREENDYWHAGGKTKWHNTPFELMARSFLGNQYLIPKNYEVYLVENYGPDWRKPKLDFDSALDTPNIEIISIRNFLIYLYKKVIISLEINQKIHSRYTSIINRYDNS
ncbi:tetratricopeptide repeat protein [Avibacterium volantium]|uniref:tetratricopeptide repeat protein n=1 Tax=Avibacterium volantium TaxID=762 RepID=UPI003BF805F6